MVTHLIRAVVFKFIFDELRAYAASKPFGGYWNEANRSYPTFFSLPLQQQITCCWMCVIHTWTGLNMATSFVYAIAVGIGAWKPYQCPPIFGDWRKLYTVRKAWS